MVNWLITDRTLKYFLISDMGALPCFLFPSCLLLLQLRLYHDHLTLNCNVFPFISLMCCKSVNMFIKFYTFAYRYDVWISWKSLFLPVRSLFLKIFFFLPTSLFGCRDWISSCVKTPAMALDYDPWMSIKIENKTKMTNAGGGELKKRGGKDVK